MGHCNDASQMVKKSGEAMKVDKDEFLAFTFAICHRPSVRLSIICRL